MTELIISEKPSAAEKIAQALADTKPKTEKKGKIKYYSLTHNNKDIIVACAVGHLFTLTEKNKHGWTYPVFDVEWKPINEVNRSSKFAKPYITLLKSLAKKADTYTIATDYDIEGEVIGFNILRYICKKNDARRMKYSTTTKEDLLESYKNALKHIDKLQAEAGVTRHTLDYYYGINLSRALTLSIKKATGMFKLLSSGRVQGPTLKILADREEEIKKFKPEPFWRVELITDKLQAWHVTENFWSKKDAETVIKNCQSKTAVVESIDAKESKQPPPPPFDLTSLQIEAHKVFGIAPKETLDIAQYLYVNSYISYPRTSSNQYPKSLNYIKLIKNLSKNPKYEKLCAELLRKNALEPNNGKKTDRAHPAIYCTGIVPKNLNPKQNKIYDLIAKRMLSTFAEPAIRQSSHIKIKVNNETFIAKGIKTAIKGWHRFYEPYLKLEENELPELYKNQELNVKELKLHELQTQPPKRYTAASIIKKLEQLNLGTKATRSEIVENLYKRDYIKEKAIEVTDLGLTTINTLKKYCPEIISEKLTAKFDHDMELILDKKKKGEDILSEAKQFLTKVLNKFKSHEQEIGKELSDATIKTRNEESIVGKCKKCGSDLKIMYSKKFKSWFIGCSNYPECKTTFSLTKGLPKPTGKTCPECGYPLVLIIRQGKRPFEYCINKECPKRVAWKKRMEELAKQKLKK